MKDKIHQIGSELVSSSDDIEFTAQRNIVQELFPYIYLASRRMSLRAISRWLASEHKVKLSDVAIARAMRNADTHWRRMVEAIEPAARIFADAHDMDPATVLRDGELFEVLETKPPKLAGVGNEAMERAYDEYTSAAAVLRNDWFAYPEEVRAQCWRHLGVLQSSEGVVKGKKHEHGKRSKTRSAR